MILKLREKSNALLRLLVDRESDLLFMQFTNKDLLALRAPRENIFGS